VEIYSGWDPMAVGFLLAVLLALDIIHGHGAANSLNPNLDADQESQCRDKTGSLDETCVISTMDTEDKLMRAFAAGAVDFRVVHSYLTSRHPPPQRDVTLCTQGSLDRLARLEQQATSWQGSLSVALYIRHDESQGEAWDKARADVHALHERVEKLGSCRLIISLVFAVDPSKAEKEFDTL
jgi:hypothetical protein